MTTSNSNPLDPKDFEAYYDAGTRQYWIRNNRHGWVQVNRSALRNHLKMAGYKTGASKPSDKLSEIESYITRLHTEKDVGYAGPLAGHHSGMIEIMGNRILVTESPELIAPKSGECPTILELMRNMFGDSESEGQLPFVLGWLKIGVESLNSGQFRPGQALVLAGERASGKSLFQKLVTHLFGGRMGRPYQYLMGQTTFNADLFQAEHLVLEDESSSVNHAKRRELGNRLKDLVVNDDQRMHAKHRTPLPVRVFWRTTVSMNDEPNNLLVLPPLEPSLEDKIILLKVHRMPMPMPTATLSEREAFMETLLSELPAFVHFLQQWEIPESMIDDRFGITHFHHPDIVEALNKQSPEYRLLEMLTQLLNQEGQSSWTGTPTELQGKLTTHTSFGSEARQLFTSAISLGYYLQRLHETHPERIYQRRDGSHGRQWVLHTETSLRSGSDTDDSDLI